ncbi:hypothetical protein HK097_010602 [Rhizophlyctis rosea]|uniref:Uncharacterized protein n=1 Tax=Rhizophlyctis rosea TaxID=64517 RepID=A0AAD5SMY9_9FUNG|nr:hypothetical protein HK097_010602 [Rhizophlyctis rosea]
MSPPALRTVVSILVFLTALGWVTVPERWDGLKSTQFVREWRKQRSARIRRAPGADPRTIGGCASPPFGNELQLFHAVVSNGWDGSGGGGFIGGRLLSLNSTTLTNWTLGTSIFPQPQSCPFLDTAFIYSSTLTSLSTTSLTNSTIRNGHVTTSHASHIGEEVVNQMDDRGCGVRVLKEEEILVNGKDPSEVVEKARGVAEIVKALPGTLAVVKNPQLGGRVGLWMAKQRGTEVAHFGVETFEGAKAIGMHTLVSFSLAEAAF